MVTSSPVVSGATPRLQNLVQNKRRSTGSYGCVREVLHPLDPRAEPSAILYYDSSSDEEFDDEFVRQRGMSEKPTKRRLSFNTDSHTKKQAAGNSQTPQKGSVYSPNSLRVPRPQALKETSPLDSPSPQGRSGLDEVTEEFLKRFSTGVGLGSTMDNENVFQTPPNRNSAGSRSSQRQNHQVQSPYTATHQSGTKAPENTPAAAFTYYEDYSRDELGSEIEKLLREIEGKPEDRSVQEIIYRLETLISYLSAFGKLEDPIGFVLEELTNNGVVELEAAHKIIGLCQRSKTRLSQYAIISRWLVHEKVYGNHGSGSPGWTPTSTPGSEFRSNTASPAPTFAFRSPKQQDFSPLQSRGFYASPTRSTRRKSDMAESIATLRKKLHHLQSNSESLGQARKINATREHELSMKQYYDQQAAEPLNKVKVEMTLDTQLQRLVEEKKAQEEAARQARIRAEEEIRREEARRQEMERQRQAAEAAARQRAAEEAERRRQEEQAARMKVQEDAQRRAREEVERKVQIQQEAQKREMEDNQKRQEEAVKERALAETKAAEQQKQVQASATGSSMAAPAAEYGRKSFESENAEMRKLLAALKDVRKQVASNRDLFKQVNVKKRALNPKLGQLNGEQGQTNLVRGFIVSTLTEIKEAGGPMVDAAIFQLNRDPRIQNKPPAQVPVLLIWMINELGKMVVRQVEAEAAVSIKTANPIGIAVVSSLAREPLLANGRSFIDIIIARLWKKCPILQGVLGPEDTVGQRTALGWKRMGDQWEGDEPHVNRMVGYVGGFAAIAGRNFMNTSQLNNPYPPFNLWAILAHMANNPDRLTNTHFFCVKAMLEVAGDTLRKVYMRQADKLIHAIFKQVAEYGVKQKFAGGQALQALGHKFERDKKFL